MDPTKSWVKEGHATDALLAHEQGHFDISNAIAEKTETAMEALLTAKGVGSWFTKSSKNAAPNAAIANWNKWSGAAHAGKIAKKGLKVQKQAQTDYDADPPVGTEARARRDQAGALGERDRQRPARLRRDMTREGGAVHRLPREDLLPRLHRLSDRDGRVADRDARCRCRRGRS